MPQNVNALVTKLFIFFKAIVLLILFLSVCVFCVFQVNSTLWRQEIPNTCRKNLINHTKGFLENNNNNNNNVKM